jgi:phosphoglycolate phosphatase-like HAD superfamily hydrolase
MQPLVFDLDGTLISCRSRQLAVLRAVTPREIKLDFDEVWHLRRSGCSTAKAIRTLGVSATLSTAIAQRWLDVIEDPFWLSLDTIQDGVVSVLEKWSKMQAHIVLLTARRFPCWLVLQLRHLALRHFFQEIYVVNPFNATEEKSKVLWRLAASAFVGDTESDATAAMQSNTPFFAVDAGQRCHAFLLNSGVSSIHSSFTEAALALEEHVLF